jgi:hypothetical protein
MESQTKTGCLFAAFLCATTIYGIASMKMRHDNKEYFKREERAILCAYTYGKILRQYELKDQKSKIKSQNILKEVLEDKLFKKTNCPIDYYALNIYMSKYPFADKKDTQKNSSADYYYVPTY